MYGVGAHEQEQEDVEAVLTGSHFATGLLLSRMLYSVQCFLYIQESMVCVDIFMHAGLCLNELCRSSMKVVVRFFFSTRED